MVHFIMLSEVGGAIVRGLVEIEHVRLVNLEIDDRFEKSRRFDGPIKGLKRR
jgi:hypothetical protein